MKYTKESFKKEWESGVCKITFNDVADCAEEWGLYSQPRTHLIGAVLVDVLEYVGIDATEYKDDEEDMDDEGECE